MEKSRKNELSAININADTHAHMHVHMNLNCLLYKRQSNVLDPG